jgi:phenylalanyl-tRNA synthetase beta chain
LGVFGELHPLVQENYDFTAPVQAAEIDLETVLTLLPAVGHSVRAVVDFPPILEDIAVVVSEDVPAARIEALIRQTGGKLLAGVRLFDIFRGPQIGEGKKSMAYGLIYQAPDRTLTDKDAAQIRQKIVRRLEQELGAKLRS